MDITPEKLYSELKKTVVGQDQYIRDLSTAAWLHSLRYQHYLKTDEAVGKPKQNLLCLGPSGSGKTLAVQAAGELLGLPVLIEDASSLRGEGWKGTSVSSIIARAYDAAQDEQDAPYCIVCLDEIDKVFRSRADPGFLPLDNLLTFLCGGVVTHTEGSRTMSLDTSGMLIICLGAFEGLDEIVGRRLTGCGSIGFGAGHGKLPSDILQHVTEADLHAYGVPWEFLGRISLVTHTSPFTLGDYRKILTESEASPVRQFDSLLHEALGVRVSITDAAVLHIAEKAEQAGTGARNLSRTVSEALSPAIYELGSDGSINGIVLDCGSSGLFVSQERAAAPAFRLRGSACRLSDIERDILDSVPFRCRNVPEKILDYAESIRKLSRQAGVLPPDYVSAAVCILASAACLCLMGRGKKNMSMASLYAALESAGTGKTADRTHFLFRQFRQFATQASGYVEDLDLAAEIAGQMILDYSRECLKQMEQQQERHTACPVL